MYLSLAFAYLQIEWNVPSLIPFSTINYMWILVKRSNFTLVFFKVACHASPGAKINLAESSSYISRHIFLKFSNTSANNNVSL